MPVKLLNSWIGPYILSHKGLQSIHAQQLACHRSPTTSVHHPSPVSLDSTSSQPAGQAVVWEACIGHKRKYSILKSTELVDYIEVTEKGTEILAESIDRPDSYYKLTWKSKGGVPKLKNWTAATHSAGVLFQDVRSWNVESIELKLNWHGDYNIWIDQSHGNVICEGCKHKWWECKRQIPKM